MTFRITPEAVEFIRGWLSRDLILTFVPGMPAPALWPADQDPPSPEELTRLAHEAVAKLPRQLVLHWEVGGAKRERLPREECRIVDGIEVHVPPEIEEPLASRVLRLDNGELVFDPPLDPLKIERPE